MIFDDEFFDVMRDEGIRMVIQHDGAGVTYLFSIPEHDLVVCQIILYPQLCQLEVCIDANDVFGDKINDLLEKRDSITTAWG